VILSLEGRKPLDQVLLFYSQAASSYTGEEMVEVQGHGGHRLLELLVDNFITAGARMAEPGEFTKRAFLNGRIDLAEAEAVADLIQAGSSRAALLAERQLEGELSRYVGKLRNDLKVMRAQMEAMIDFPEDEDVQGLHHFEIKERVGVIVDRISKLTATYEEGRILKEGVRAAIVGKPNTGKSSLFNALLQQDRAIVHATPGTTRDLIEESLDLKGLIVRFIDTAGIREGKESIETEGIRRTEERLKQSDIVLAVFDGSRKLDDEDKKVLELVKERPVFYLYNKSDLSSAFSATSLKDLSPSLSLSAKTGEGIEALKAALFSRFVKEEKKTDDLTLTNLRHRIALQKGKEILDKVIVACDEKRSLELLAADLSLAMNALGEVTGEVTSDEILGEIFSKFCIGK
jgi:tRNA modification GTPase